MTPVQILAVFLSILMTFFSWKETGGFIHFGNKDAAVLESNCFRGCIKDFTHRIEKKFSRFHNGRIKGYEFWKSIFTSKFNYQSERKKIKIICGEYTKMYACRNQHCKNKKFLPQFSTWRVVDLICYTHKRALMKSLKCLNKKQGTISKVCSKNSTSFKCLMKDFQQATGPGSVTRSLKKYCSKTSKAAKCMSKITAKSCGTKTGKIMEDIQNAHLKTVKRKLRSFGFTKSVMPRTCRRLKPIKIEETRAKTLPRELIKEPSMVVQTLNSSNDIRQSQRFHYQTPTSNNKLTSTLLTSTSTTPSPTVTVVTVQEAETKPTIVTNGLPLTGATLRWYCLIHSFMTFFNGWN